METRHCKYTKCKKPISMVTRYGRKIAPHRYAKQTFCTDTCARLDYFAKRQAAIDALSEANKIINDWIYGRTA